MKAKKSANSKVPSRALHAKSRKDSCTNNVHPDVILDADEALRYILGRLTKLEDEVAPIKIENKELKSVMDTLSRNTDKILQKSRNRMRKSAH